MLFILGHSSCFFLTLVIIYLAGSESRVQAEPLASDASHTFFSGSKASTTTTLGGKASLQPERTPLSKEEIEAILLGGCI